jgi:hypothetical protein
VLENVVYTKNCSGGTCYCNNVGDVPLSWQASASGIGHSIYAVEFADNGGGLNGFSVRIWHTNGSVTYNGMSRILCGRFSLGGVGW